MKDIWRWRIRKEERDSKAERKKMGGEGKENEDEEKLRGERGSKQGNMSGGKRGAVKLNIWEES